MLGYLKKWKTSQMLLHIAFFIDVLTPAAELSKIYQEDDIDIVSATSALNRTKHKLQLYSNLSLQDLPVTKYLLSKVEEESGTHTYQGIQFSSTQFERELELLKAKKNRITNPSVLVFLPDWMIQSQRLLPYRTYCHCFKC